MGGGGGVGQKICGGGGGVTLALRNQISVKYVFVCSTHTFHKNICFTVCFNSAGFCDSAMVNIGFKYSMLLSAGCFLLHSYCKHESSYYIQAMKTT